MKRYLRQRLKKKQVKCICTGQSLALLVTLVVLDCACELNVVLMRPWPSGRTFASHVVGRGSIPGRATPKMMIINK